MQHAACPRNGNGTGLQASGRPARGAGVACLRNGTDLQASARPARGDPVALLR